MYVCSQGINGLLLKLYLLGCVGEAVILRHVRNGVELPPIDQNLFYDFDYQLTNHITPRVVLPVSICTAYDYILCI